VAQMKNSERLFGYALEAERLASHMSQPAAFIRRTSTWSSLMQRAKNRRVGNMDATALENAIRWNLRRRDCERAKNNYDAADHFEANARQLRQRLCKGA
jgi:hypothetical protein